MSTGTQSSPIPDLLYDWLTVIQSKAEGLNAYDKYIKDAERENASACVAMFQKLREQDAKQVEELKTHLKKVMEHFHV